MKYKAGDTVYGWTVYRDIMGQPLTVTEVIDWGPGRQWYRVSEVPYVLRAQDVSHIKFSSVSELLNQK